MIDPLVQVGYIQQSLSQDKRPLGFFLGAGCPTSVQLSGKPLIPDIAGLTKEVLGQVQAEKKYDQLLSVAADHFAKDGRSDLNIESLLSHVRGLKAVAGKEGARGLKAEELDKLDIEICRLIYVVVDKALPSAQTPYHDLARWIDAVMRDKPVEIFTTNYDLLMEQALEDCHVPYFDGFAGVRKPFFDLRAMEEDRRAGRVFGNYMAPSTGTKMRIVQLC